MELQDFLQKLTDIVKENPETLYLEVITCIDDKGDVFVPVHYTPTTGYFNGQDFEQNAAEKGIEIDNAICLN